MQLHLLMSVTRGKLPVASSSTLPEMNNMPSWRKGTVPLSNTSTDKATAEQLKQEGNTLFAKKKYAAAIEKYTEAYTCYPLPVLLVNRALCHKIRGDWDKVEHDARQALELDSKNMKAHYYIGLACRERGDLDESCQHLVKALEMAREQGDSIKDEIFREQAKAQYARWERDSAVRREERSLLLHKVEALLKKEQAAQQQQQNGADEAAEPGQAQDAEREVALLRQVFSDAARRDSAAQPASSFVCRLTMEVFREPAITPSGLSYERGPLLEHLQKVGKFDPITRQPLREQDVVSNYGLRAATQEYLNEHPWAWAECF